MAVPLTVPVRPALAPYVREITVEMGSVANPATPTPYRILPGIAPVIGFQLRGRLSVLRGNRSELLGRSGITGIQSTARWFLAATETRSIIVRLAPFGGYVLLGRCMAETADRHVPLDQMLPGMRSLEDELQELDPREAAEKVQNWLLERLSVRKRDVDPKVIAAWRAITHTCGRERVEAVARNLGMDRRRLERLFREQIGVTPRNLPFSSGSKVWCGGKAETPGRTWRSMPVTPIRPTSYGTSSGAPA